jgi:hypothetical protein
MHIPFLCMKICGKQLDKLYASYTCIYEDISAAILTV